MEKAFCDYSSIDRLAPIRRDGFSISIVILSMRTMFNHHFRSISESISISRNYCGLLQISMVYVELQRHRSGPRDIVKIEVTVGRISLKSQ